MNEDYRYIAAIAEHGSISGAARSEHISQPGLSQRLRRLEQQMGVPLFDRSTAPLKPTPAGDVYLRYAYRALAAEKRLRHDLEGISNGKLARLRIGVSAARADSLLSSPLVSFYETHQGCTVELHEMSTLDQLHDLFIYGSIDCAVLTPIAPDPMLYESEILCREKLMVAAPASSRFPQLRDVPKGSKVHLRQLEGVPFVLPTCGNYYDPLIDKAIEVSSAQLDIIARGCSAQLALGMVEEGLGVAIAPSTSVVGRTAVIAYELGDVSAGNVLRYIRQRSHTVPSEELLFIDILKGWLAQALA